jgi:hypothetical protein
MVKIIHCIILIVTGYNIKHKNLNTNILKKIKKYRITSNDI